MSRKLACIQALIIDMDGVLWRGAQALPGVADFFAFLAKNSIHFLLATNNATRTAQYAVDRMASLGVAVQAEHVLTSAGATARWLRNQLPGGARVLVVGEAGLLQTLAQAGFQPIDADVPNTTGQNAAAVVVGLDRAFTYDKLLRAMVEIRAGARFVATNGDATFPAEQGLVPGAGSIVAAVETASGAPPTTVGKPNRPMFDAALELLQTSPANTAMLGDRLDTDIEGGQRAGLATILVLTGVTTPDEIAASPIKPDWTFRTLVELQEQWKIEQSRDE